MLAIFTSDSRSIDLVVGNVSFGPGKNVRPVVEDCFETMCSVILDLTFREAFGYR